jgi:hypothetical protein
MMDGVIEAMIKVKSIDEETINNWAIPESGLPARIMNVCIKSE